MSHKAFWFVVTSVSHALYVVLIFQLFSYLPVSFDGYSRTLRTVIAWLVVLLRTYLLHCSYYGLFDILQKHLMHCLFFGLINFTVSPISNELFNLFLVCLVEMRISIFKLRDFHARQKLYSKVKHTSTYPVLR